MLATKEDYTTYYNKQLEKALEFQDFVADKLYNIGISLNCYSSRKYQYEKGESRSGIEIKFDDQRKKTGNLYIEYAEKSNPNNKNYVPSGIERKDNTWLYVIGDYDEQGKYRILRKDLGERKNYCMLIRSNMLSDLQHIENLTGCYPYIRKSVQIKGILGNL